MTERFGDLWFRGTWWYLAKDVDQKLAECNENAEHTDMVIRELRDNHHHKLEAVKNYCLNTLGTTEDFPNWMKPIRDEMENILKILEAEG